MNWIHQTKYEPILNLYKLVWGIQKAQLHLLKVGQCLGVGTFFQWLSATAPFKKAMILGNMLVFFYRLPLKRLSSPVSSSRLLGAVFRLYRLPLNTFTNFLTNCGLKETYSLDNKLCSKIVLPSFQAISLPIKNCQEPWNIKWYILYDNVIVLSLFLSQFK